MLKKQFPKLNGLISTLLQEKRNTCKPMRNQLQIIHSRDDHWIVASTVLSKSDKVHVYDSAYSTIDERTKGIICNLFISDKIVIKMSQKQGNGEDCGLFAIANATLISKGIDHCSVKLMTSFYEQTLQSALMKAL